MNLRPSSLPKIAVCACYEGDSTGSKYSERGTALDVVFRAVLTTHANSGVCLTGEELDATTRLASSLAPEESQAVEWAINAALALAGDSVIEAREEHLRIEALGLPGTADALCEASQWSADLKSGEKRNYREQQACYALGFMDKFFEDEWTVYLLYCDLREVERLHFTHEEAEDIVRRMIARGTDPQRVPTPCEYCAWCVKRFTCTPRIEAASPLVPVCEAESPEQAFEIILADNDRLGAFLKAVKVVGELEERARQVAKDRLVEGKAGGLKIPGVSLVTKRVGQILAAVDLQPIIEKIGPEAVLAEMGSVSRAKAEKLFEKAGIEFPADKLTETAGSCYVQVRA